MHSTLVEVAPSASAELPQCYENTPLPTVKHFPFGISPTVVRPLAAVDHAPALILCWRLEALLAAGRSPSSSWLPLWGHTRDRNAHHGRHSRCTQVFGHQNSNRLGRAGGSCRSTLI